MRTQFFYDTLVISVLDVRKFCSEFTTCRVRCLPYKKILKYVCKEKNKLLELVSNSFVFLYLHKLCLNESFFLS